MKSKKKSAPKSSSSGRTFIYVIFGIVIFALVVGYLGIQPGGFISKTMIQKVPSQNSQVPFEQWSTYSNENPKFSIKYPTDWVYQIREGSGAPDNLLTVAFLPNTGNAIDKTNVIMVKVLNRKDAVSLQDWVNKYTTRLYSDVAAEQGKDKGVALFGVDSISNTKIGNRDAITYIFKSNSAGEANGVILMSENYVVSLLSLQGKAEDTKAKMIESLSF